MTKTFNIRGQKIRTASQCRFIAVACRPESFEGKRWDHRVERTVTIDGREVVQSGGYVPETFRAFGPTIVKRSDNVAVVRKAAEKYGCPAGGWVIVVDTTTGKEV